MHVLNDSPPHILESAKAAIAGDSVALSIVFQYYRPRLLAHALRLCGNTPTAQDAVQDSYINAHLHICSLRDPSVVYPWLRKVLFNTCYLLLRKERTMRSLHNAIDTDAGIDQTIEQQFDRSSNKQILYHQMSMLSEELRSCVLLRYYSNYNSYEEIATILGIPVGTVRSRLSAAREKLTKMFTACADGAEAALRQAVQWTEYYHHAWTHAYSDVQVRDEFLGHLLPDLRVRFTSGKMGQGRSILEREMYDDLHYGSRFHVRDVSSCGNISVIEGVNTNTTEYPDRCAPSSVFVMFRDQHQVETMHLFDSSRTGIP